MDLKEINAKLKEIGLGNVKLRHTEGWNGKVYKDQFGKMVKGIEGGSIGPMTMSNAHQEHNREIEDKLREAFPYNYSQEHGFMKLTFDLGKKTRVYSFGWNLYPSNTRAMDLDPSYQTYWFTPIIKDSKN